MLFPSPTTDPLAVLSDFFECFGILFVVFVMSADDEDDDDDEAQTTFEMLAFACYFLLLCLNGRAIAAVLTGPR